MHDARQAVQVFYIISGFYMAMVLSSRYSRPRDFYISRLLRIFPTYWVVLAGTIIVSMGLGLLHGNWLMLTPYLSHPSDHNGLLGVVLTALTNVTLIGQDWVMFLSHAWGRPLQLTGDFARDVSPLWRYLLLPQCWSVGVELTFYAMVPLLNRLRSRWLILIAALSIASRLYAYWRLGLNHDPWTYRFFPFELGLFLFGMLGYRLYVKSAPYHPPQRFRCVSLRSYLVAAGLLMLTLYVLVGTVWNIGDVTTQDLGPLASFPLWIVIIPVLFFVFGNQKLDRMIGELSYPIYLVHFVVVAVASIPLGHLNLMRWNGVVCAVLSIIASAVLYGLVIARLDKRRHVIADVGEKACATTT